MKSNVRVAAGVAIIILGLLVIITPRYLFPVCEEQNGHSGTATSMDATMSTDDMDMGTTAGSSTQDMDEMDMSTGHADCYYTSRGALMMGLLIMLGGAAMMLATTANAVRLLSLVLGGMGAVVILTPTYFLPICENPQMACHDGAEPLLIVLGGLVILVAAVLASMAGNRQPGQG